jgi:hypothetical protein
VLKDSILKFLKVDSLVEHLTGYVETRIELMKWELKEDLAKVLAKVSVYLLLAFVLVLVIFFISTALAYKIGKYVGMSGGFAIVGGIYLLIALGLLFYRISIMNRIEKEVKEVMKQKK